MLINILSHRVLKNVSALAILQIFNYAAPLIVLIYLTRVLGVDLYGVVAFSVSIVQISYVLLDFGFSLSATQKISFFREKKRYVSRYIGAIFAVKFIFFLILSLILFGYASTTEKYSAHRLLLIFSLFPIFGQAFQPVWFFLGIEKMSYITISMVIAKLLFVVMVVLFVQKDADYLWVPVANGASQLAAASFCIYFLYKNKYSISFPAARDIKYAIRTSLGFFSSRVSVAIYSNGGVFVLGLFSTPYAVSVYSISEQLYRVMQSIFMPVTQAIYPYMAKEKNYKLLFKLSIASFVTVSLGSLLGYFASPYLVSYIFGQEWLVILPTLNIFLCVVIINVLGVVSGYPLAAALRKTNVVNRSTIYASILYITCITFFFSFSLLEPIYMAIAVLLVEIYVLVYRGIKLWPSAHKELVGK